MSCSISYKISNPRHIHISVIGSEGQQLNIIDENGKSLLKVEDRNDYEIIESDGKQKLFVYKPISSRFHSKSQTLVYSISQLIYTTIKQ